jgi:hypothetical protein
MAKIGDKDQSGVYQCTGLVLVLKEQGLKAFQQWVRLSPLVEICINNINSADNL